MAHRIRAGGDPVLVALREQWRSKWEEALGAWSSFTKLSEPRWCLTEEDEEKEGLTGSFAMIRLVDHAVVISLRQVVEQRVSNFATEILAHEIGHHVYVPGDLTDNARLLSATRAGLPGCERLAPMISNLYSDLLINDRLQRAAGLDMAGVYRALKSEAHQDLWTFYIHTYEILWGLSTGSLFDGELTDRIRADAILASRLVRNYSGDWLSGAGQFAVLCLDYLGGLQDQTVLFLPWLDAAQAGAGGEVPEGLTTMSAEEMEGPRHPALGELNGLSGEGDGDGDGEAKSGQGDEMKEVGLTSGYGRELLGGTKTYKRTPEDYVELMKSLGVEIDVRDLIIKYYRESARPYLAPFPIRGEAPLMETQIEGVQLWEPGAPLSAIDWMETTFRSPFIIPGVTTVERIIGEVKGDDKDARPADLYLGIDCSGSMANPARTVSYPAVAGAVVSMSALRAGAKVKTVLSGAPGQHSETDGYSSSLRKNLGVLTGYLGTGYAFGFDRLEADFVHGESRDNPVHILLITDTDIFAMAENHPDGFEVAKVAVEKAGAGLSCVLEYAGDLKHGRFAATSERLREVGWEIYQVTNEEELVAFSREFSRKKYTVERGAKR